MEDISYKTVVLIVFTSVVYRFNIRVKYQHTLYLGLSPSLVKFIWYSETDPYQIVNLADNKKKSMLHSALLIAVMFFLHKRLYNIYFTGG